MAFYPFDEDAFGGQLAAIDRLRAELDARPLVLGWSGQLARDLTARAVQASTNMEGVPVTVDEVHRILAGERPSTVSAESYALVRGYRDAMTYCQRRADDPALKWAPELIIGIQDRILAGRQDWGAGRYGKGSYITNSASGELIYTPPQENLEEYVQRICDRMNSWDCHPALKSAWVHIAFAAIHPFKDGNGRTARVLASLAMYQGGFKRAQFTSLEEWWGRYRAAYADAFACLGSSFNPQRDVTRFIDTHVRAQISQVSALRAAEQTYRRLLDGLTALCEQLQLPDRSAFALWDTFHGRAVTRPLYMAVTQIKENAATADLRAMMAAGLLIAEGRTRDKRWVTGPNLYPQLGKVFGLDPERSNRDSIIQAITRRVFAEHTEDAAMGNQMQLFVPAGHASSGAASTYSVQTGAATSTRSGGPNDVSLATDPEDQLRRSTPR